MFGYVTTNQEELKIKDFRRYQTFYCGLCRDLGDRHGQTARLTLTYDMTFLAVLLTGLYEPEERVEERFCPLHPAKKRICRRNAAVSYAADMNLLLCYYNLLDDWLDEKKPVPLALARMIRGDVREIMIKYPRQARAVRQYMKKLRECELENSPDLDRASGDTGRMLAEIFVWKDDHWKETLGKVGFYLGKFIYLMDAFEDVEKDRKTGNYNPWRFIADEEKFQDRALQILTMLAARCSGEFEKLPVVEYVDILRNILYSGIWTKYERLKKSDEE